MSGGCNRAQSQRPFPDENHPRPTLSSRHSTLGYAFLTTSGHRFLAGTRRNRRGSVQCQRPSNGRRISNRGTPAHCQNIRVFDNHHNSRSDRPCDDRSAESRTSLAQNMPFSPIGRNRRLPFFSGGLCCEVFVLELRATDGGDRTHTHLRELDFESSASANSATSACLRRQFVIRLPRNASRSSGRTARSKKKPPKSRTW